MKKDRSKNDEDRSPQTGLGHDPAKTGTVPRSARTRGTVPVFGSCPAPEDPVEESIKRRVARWEAKYTPERMAAILGAKGEQMRERFRVQTEMLGRVEQRVGEVTDAAGIPVMMRIWYKSFGREVCRIWRTIPSSCQELEYDVIRYKWTARGLEPTLLASVKAAVVELLDSSDFPRKD